jgi:hypothetical protein
MTSTNKTASTVVAKFKWNDETSSKAIELYAALLGATVGKANELEYVDGKKPSQEVHAAANSEKSLNEIAVKLGAKSGRAVRGKLAKEGVYIALEAQAAPSTSTRISKGQYVRSIAKGLGLEMESIQTLDKANLEALETLVTKTNEILQAASLPLIEVK